MTATEPAGRGSGARSRRLRAAHPWQTRIALAALILPAPVTLALLVGGVPAFRLAVTVALSSVPLAFRADRARFMTSCVVLGIALAGWSILGAWEGTLIFFPSALLLLCAAFADPREYQAPATAVTALACLLAVVPGLFFVGCLAGLVF
ncbi:hypothetical protein [Streptomyces sp. A1547]|uniref:hypothetical protein n=1 Tax=Streptomyces sp. A1547 TaxID=2563105 RepID=UPI00109E6C55|nr:hypothetical protein [Streptomyces sp. A1547]THA37301.1 hypothetical protein E6W17_21085 [Streptomyces sp. A1547]